MTILNEGLRTQVRRLQDKGYFSSGYENPIKSSTDGFEEKISQVARFIKHVLTKHPEITSAKKLMRKVEENIKTIDQEYCDTVLELFKETVDALLRKSFSSLSSDSDDTPAPTRRRRDMLKAYYGIAEKTTKPKSAIDEKDFDAEKFAAKLLKEGKLKDLLAKDIELTNDMRKLDNELQMLVYGNYTNFINATKLISNMKDSVTGMRSRISNLNTSLTQVGTLNSTIQSELGGNKSKIQKLLTVNGTLKKIDFVVTLPNRLQEYISVKAYASAVTYWGVGYQILHRHNHIKSFSHVNTRCVEIINSLHEELVMALKECFISSDNRQASSIVKYISDIEKTGCGSVDSVAESETVSCLVKKMVSDELQTNVEQGLPVLLSESNMETPDTKILQAVSALLLHSSEKVTSGVSLLHITPHDGTAYAHRIVQPHVLICIEKTCEFVAQIASHRVELLMNDCSAIIEGDIDVPLAEKSEKFASGMAVQLSDLIQGSVTLVKRFFSSPEKAILNVRNEFFSSIRKMYSNLESLLLRKKTQSTSLALLSFMTQYNLHTVPVICESARIFPDGADLADDLIKISSKLTTTAATNFIVSTGVKATNLLWNYPQSLETYSEGDSLVNKNIMLAMKEVEKARRAVMQGLPSGKKSVSKDEKSQASSQSRPTSYASLAIAAQLEAVLHPSCSYGVSVIVADVSNVVRCLCLYLLRSVLELIRTATVSSPAALHSLQSDVLYLSIGMSDICNSSDIVSLIDEILHNATDRCRGGDLKEKDEAITEVLEFMRLSR